MHWVEERVLVQSIFAIQDVGFNSRNVLIPARTANSLSEF